MARNGTGQLVPFLAVDLLKKEGERVAGMKRTAQEA